MSVSNACVFAFTREDPNHRAFISRKGNARMYMTMKRLMRAAAKALLINSQLHAQLLSRPAGQASHSRAVRGRRDQSLRVEGRVVCECRGASTRARKIFLLSEAPVTSTSQLLSNWPVADNHHRCWEQHVDQHCTHLWGFLCCPLESERESKI
jgi:hypothetical protein